MAAKFDRAQLAYERQETLVAVIFDRQLCATDFQQANTTRQQPSCRTWFAVVNTLAQQIVATCFAACEGGPAHVTKCLQNGQPIPFIHPKQGIMQHQQLPTVHELARNSYPALSAHWKMICNQHR